MIHKLLFAIATLSLSVSCHNVKKNVPATLMQVETVAARSEVIPNRQTYIGHVSAAYSSVIQPRVNGYLAEVLYDNGMPVRKGQVIFRLDGRQQRARMLAAKAELESARANAIEAANNYERAIPLARINAISQAQLDQRTAEYEASQAAVKSAEQTLVDANLDVEYTTLRSPIDGIIASTSAYIGDYVGPGTQFSTLTTIQNTDTVSVDLAIPMQQYLAYSGRKSFTYDNKGLLSDIELYLADGRLYPHKGFYNYTKPDVSNMMGTIIIVVSFPNPESLLKSGQFARVKCNVGNGIRGIIIPQQAVTERQNVTSVWVVDSVDTARFRHVTLGDTYGKWRIVASGLKAGERVAVDGLDKLHDGEKVVPVNSDGNE